MTAVFIRLRVPGPLATERCPDCYAHGDTNANANRNVAESNANA